MINRWKGLDHLTNSPHQYHKECIENGYENLHLVTTYIQSISAVLSAHLDLENSSFMGVLMASLRAGYTTMVNPATGIRN